MMIDTIGKRYGMLPSEVIGRATTFDIFILDAALGYEAYLNNKHNKDSMPKESVPLDSPDALKRLEEFRKKNEINSKPK